MKRGAISLSFGFIFSVILIVAIIAAAFYAISYFLDLRNCTEVALFYQEFQKEMDGAWSSEITRDTFSGTLPSGVEKVCVGDVEKGINTEEYSELRRFRSADANLYLFPPKKTCDLPAQRIEHIDTDELGFYCYDVRSGRVEIPYEKGSFDSLVKLKRAE